MNNLFKMLFVLVLGILFFIPIFAANKSGSCASGDAAGCADFKKAIVEAEAASGIKVTVNP
tara:strand:- start:162 stop:344 length:183 start_codon:yes stop_codon:yes gene_type:complete